MSLSSREVGSAMALLFDGAGPAWTTRFAGVSLQVPNAHDLTRAHAMSAGRGCASLAWARHADPRDAVRARERRRAHRLPGLRGRVGRARALRRPRERHRAVLGGAARATVVRAPRV